MCSARIQQYGNATEVPISDHSDSLLWSCSSCDPYKHYHLGRALLPMCDSIVCMYNIQAGLAAVMYVHLTTRWPQLLSGAAFPGLPLRSLTESCTI